MSVSVVVGAQWGDEAKGKIVDLLAQRARYVVRYAGGSNAGHTVCVDGATYKFHLIPSGILHPQVIAVIADGVVMDLRAFSTEATALQQQGVDLSRLRIGRGVHLTMPYHRLLDELEEAQIEGRIGTTKRGIGPTYADKAWRIGVRVADLLERDRLAVRIRRVLQRRNPTIERVYGATPLHPDALIEEFAQYAEMIRPYACDAPYLLMDALERGEPILMEGAQGTLLDLDYGTYPYVTSSHPIAAGACLGTGIAPNRLTEIWGVAKAYTTRVGEGPFPTELRDAIGDRIRNRGREYGVTTGRARRVGWLDLVALRYAARVNGFTALALTLLDVLSGLETLKVCIAYRLGGSETREFIADAHQLAHCEPVYNELPGWTEEIGGCRSLDDLPPNALRYLNFIENYVGAPVKIVSVGPSREQTILV
ncbi:MAG: adenylosuccinate synthetase [Fimbriimonadales bacterium]|nr:MAG: adenylosuccinate synthetase [Fimbriimonadales bacterium]